MWSAIFLNEKIMFNIRDWDHRNNIIWAIRPLSISWQLKNKLRHGINDATFKMRRRKIRFETVLCMLNSFILSILTLSNLYYCFKDQYELLDPSYAQYQFSDPQYERASRMSTLIEHPSKMMQSSSLMKKYVLKICAKITN